MSKGTLGDDVAAGMKVAGYDVGQFPRVAETAVSEDVGAATVEAFDHAVGLRAARRAARRAAAVRDAMAAASIS